jgi:CxxC-x17-CxxC domain-containing protein
MNDFKKSRSSSRGPAGRDFDDRKEMHKTNCSKCRTQCEVPFKPNGKKPVFCSNCYVRDEAQQSGGGSFEKRSYGPERSFSRESAAPSADTIRIAAIQKELNVVHAKLDTLIANLAAASR